MQERIAEVLPLRLHSDHLPSVIEHLALYVGIAVFQWSLTEIAFLYVSEIVVINILFPTVALFAADPVETLESDHWREETQPRTLRPVQWLPPIYSRNLKLAGKYAVFAFIFVILIPLTALSEFSQNTPQSLLTMSTLMAIGGICLAQLRRVYQEFVSNQQYQTRSPAEALRFGVIPLLEVLMILLCVVVPITVILVAGMFATGIDAIESQVVLWAYLLPIGVVRVYVRGAEWDFTFTKGGIQL